MTCTPPIKCFAKIVSLLIMIGFCTEHFIQPVSAQESDFRVLVNGKPFAGMFAAPEKRGRKLFLPAMAIAILLGDQLSIDTDKQIIRVRRQNGVVAEFDPQSRQVKENGAVTLSLSSVADVTIPPYEEFLLLPTEIIITLFDVSVQIDTTKREIHIKRAADSERQITTTEKKEKAFELYQADYDYRFDKYDLAFNHYLTFNAKGRVGENNFSLLLNNSRGRSKYSFFQPRSGTLVVTRPNGQEFTVGSASTSANLLFIQTLMTGAKFSVPAFNGRFNAFGGKTVSGLYYSGDNRLIQPKRSESLVFGGSFNFDDLKTIKSRGSLDKSVGVLFFSNNQKETGLILTGGANYSTGKANLRADIAAGSFSALPQIGNENQNFGFAARVSGNIRLSDQFAVQGHLLQISRDFQSPRRYQNYPQNTFGGGFSWRPVSWMSAAFNSSISKRTDLSAFETRSFSTTVNIAPRDRSLPTLYFSHLQLGTNQFRSGAITMLNATKDFSRWQFFTNLTRIKTIGAAAANIQIGARTSSFAGGFLQVSQLFGNHGIYGGNFDWRTGEAFTKRLSFSAGVGYFRNTDGSFALTQRASTFLRLPRRTTLQFDYLKSPNGYQFGISLRGSFLKSNNVSHYYLTPEQKPERFSSIYGRVFQDINENGEFEQDTDIPQPDVRLRLETGQTVSTDANGFYRFNNIPGGEYKIFLDPLTVRADLTLLDGQEVKLTLLPARNTNIDFRLVRTGQVTGTIWLDRNGNNRQDEDEQPLADVRVIAGNGHDTLTDSTGSFTIGDLSPGEYVLFVDEKTLPENTKLATDTLTIKITAGSRTSDILLPIIPKPALIKTF